MRISSVVACTAVVHIGWAYPINSFDLSEPQNALSYGRNTITEATSPLHSSVPDLAEHPLFFEDAYVQEDFSDAQAMDWLSSRGPEDELMDFAASTVLAVDVEMASASLSDDFASGLEGAGWWNEAYTIVDHPLLSHADNAPPESIIWEDFADFLAEEPIDSMIVRNDTAGDSEGLPLSVVSILEPFQQRSRNGTRDDEDGTRDHGAPPSWTFPVAAAMLATTLAVGREEQNPDPEGLEEESFEAKTPVLSPQVGTFQTDVYDPDDVYEGLRSPLRQPYSTRLLPSPSPEPMRPMSEVKKDESDAVLVHFMTNKKYDNASARRETAPSPLRKDIPGLVLDEDCSTSTRHLGYAYMGESSTSGSSKEFKCVYRGCEAGYFQSQYLLERQASVAHYSLEQNHRRNAQGGWRERYSTDQTSIRQLGQYPCRFCPNRFYASRSHVRLHFRVHHPNNMDEIDTERQPGDPPRASVTNSQQTHLSNMSHPPAPAPDRHEQPPPRYIESFPESKTLHAIGELDVGRPSNDQTVQTQEGNTPLEYGDCIMQDIYPCTPHQEDSNSINDFPDRATNLNPPALQPPHQPLPPYHLLLPISLASHENNTNTNTNININSNPNPNPNPNPDPDPTPQALPNDPQRYQCPHCPQTFSQPHQKRRHINTHVKPEKCTEQNCRWAFATAKDLRRHTISVHGGQEDRVVCTVQGCGEVFTRQDNLMRHVRIVHSD